MGEDAWEIRWTHRADRDLGGAVLYLAERNPKAAERWVRELLAQVGLLAAQREMGSPVELDGGGTGYRRVICGGYSVFYRFEEALRVVFVLRVWHSARDPQALSLE